MRADGNTSWTWERRGDSVPPEDWAPDPAGYARDRYFTARSTARTPVAPEDVDPVWTQAATEEAAVRALKCPPLAPSRRRATPTRARGLHKGFFPGNECGTGRAWAARIQSP